MSVEEPFLAEAGGAPPGTGTRGAATVERAAPEDFQRFYEELDAVLASPETPLDVLRRAWGSPAEDEGVLADAERRLGVGEWLRRGADASESRRAGMRRADVGGESEDDAEAERVETEEVSEPSTRRLRGRPRGPRSEAQRGDDADRGEEGREPDEGGEAPRDPTAGEDLRRRDEELDIRRRQLELDERREARLARELDARLLASEREQRVLDVQLQTLEVARQGLRHQVQRGSADDAEKREKALHADLAKRTGCDFSFDTDHERRVLQACGGPPLCDYATGVSQVALQLQRQTARAPEELELYTLNFDASGQKVLRFDAPLTERIVLLTATLGLGGSHGRFFLRWWEFQQMRTPAQFRNPAAITAWGTCPPSPARPAARDDDVFRWAEAERRRAYLFAAVVSRGYLAGLEASVSRLEDLLRPMRGAAERIQLDTAAAVMNEVYVRLRADARAFLDQAGLAIPAGAVEPDAVTSLVREAQRERIVVRAPDLRTDGRDILDRFLRQQADEIAEVSLELALQQRRSKQDADALSAKAKADLEAKTKKRAGKLTLEARRGPLELPMGLNPPMGHLAPQQEGSPDEPIRIERQMAEAFGPPAPDGRQCCLACNSHDGAPGGARPCPMLLKGVVHQAYPSLGVGEQPHVAVLLVLAASGGWAGGPFYATPQQRGAALRGFRRRLFWTTPGATPEDDGAKLDTDRAGRSSEPGEQAESGELDDDGAAGFEERPIPADDRADAPGSGDSHGPLSGLLTGLYAREHGIEDHAQRALAGLYGDPDRAFLGERVNVGAPKRTWDQATDCGPGVTPALRESVCEALVTTPEGQRVFSWLRARVDETKDGSPEREVADRAFAHVLGVALNNVPLTLSHEAIAFWLGEGFALGTKSVVPGNRELAHRGIAALYPDGLPEQPQLGRSPSSGGVAGRRERTFVLQRGTSDAAGYVPVSVASLEGRWTGVDRDEAFAHPQTGAPERQACVLIATAALAGVRPHRVQEEGRAEAAAVKLAIGGLPEEGSIVPFEAELREAAHDYEHGDHDHSRLSITLFRLPCLAGRVVRVLEVTGGVITRVTVVDHPPRTEITDDVILFYRPGIEPFAEFSNFYAGPDGAFELDGVAFQTAEHALMHAKASFFGDADAAAEVLRAGDPDEAKRIGRRVRNFSSREWHKVVDSIIDRVLTAKFGQNNRLRELLVATGVRPLGEASRDRLWGTGHPFGAAEARDTAAWGTNLLGRALQRTRARLRDQVGLVLLFHFEESDAHCYALKPPQGLQDGPSFDSWISRLELDGVVVERRTAGWESSLETARLVEDPVDVDALPSCAVCGSKGTTTRRAAGRSSRPSHTKGLNAAARPWSPGAAVEAAFGTPLRSYSPAAVLRSLLGPEARGEIRGDPGKRAGARRRRMAVSPPSASPGAVNPDQLKLPPLTVQQVGAAEAAVAAVVDADRTYTAQWRAILGAKFHCLLRACCGAELPPLELAVLAYRAAWYRRHPRSLDVGRLALAAGLGGEEAERYRRVAALGDCAGGGVSACLQAPAGAKAKARRPRLAPEINTIAWDESWKRIVNGRGFLIGPGVADVLGIGLLRAPQLAVPKMDSQGRVRPGVWRLCSNHSAAGAANERTSKFHFPRPVFPTPEQITRQGLRLQLSYPGCDVRGLRLDIDSAYNIVDIAAGDVHAFAARLEDELDAAKLWDVVATTLDFGFRGSSGAFFGAVAQGFDAWQASHRPTAPHLNGPEAFSFSIFGDDGILTEADLFNRVGSAKACGIVGATIFAGPKSINADKFALDGVPSTTLTAVGLTRELVSGTVSVSPERVAKALGRWMNPEYDYGNRAITLKRLQEAVGSLRHLAQVRRSILAAFSAFNRFLAAADDSPTEVAQPKGTAAEVEWHFHCLWRWAEVVRLELQRPVRWKAAVTAVGINALSIRERLALPGFAEKVFLIAGDANEHVTFTIDARRKRCSFLFWTTKLISTVRAALSDLGMPVDLQGDFIISIKEMTGPTLAADLWGVDHKGATAVVINDNQNVCTWVDRRQSSNSIAQHLIMILSRAESRDGADYAAAYVNTKVNAVADAGTRVLLCESGDAALRRFDDYVSWAATTLPGFSVEDWTLEGTSLLSRATSMGSLRLCREVGGNETAASPAPRPGSDGRCGMRRGTRLRLPVDRMKPSWGPDSTHPGDFSSFEDRGSEVDECARFIDAARATERAREASGALLRPDGPSRTSQFIARKLGGNDEPDDELANDIDELFAVATTEGAGGSRPSLAARIVAAGVARRPAATEAEPIGMVGSATPRGAPLSKRRAIRETWLPSTNAQLDRIGLQLVDDSICPETRARYGAHFEHWRLFCERRLVDGERRGPWLDQENPERDERLVLDFVAYEGLLTNGGKGWATSTVRHKLAAVRFFHVRSYFPDPTGGKPRVKAALRALERRRREPSALKLPVTKDMLIRIRTRAARGIGKFAGRCERDRRVVIAAVTVAWFFLLRSSEYASFNGSTKDYVLNVADVAFYSVAGKLIDLRSASSAAAMSILIKGSKTDQARMGCVRRLNSTGEDLDPVSACASMVQLFTPEELADPAAPFFLLSSGHAVSNRDVSDELKDAAEDLGMERGRFASHSLRRGGATAMAAAGISTEIIRRWGRWLSDAYKRYVFGSMEELADLSKSMAQAEYSLAMAVEDFFPSAPLGTEAGQGQEKGGLPSGSVEA